MFSTSTAHTSIIGLNCCQESLKETVGSQWKAAVAVWEGEKDIENSS
jgi:hypothetical protein